MAELATTHDQLAELTSRAREAGVVYPSDLDVALVATPGATLRSFHLTMRDGVRVAVDLHLPRLVKGEPIATALRSTRYWRAGVGDPAKEHVSALEGARWTSAGFALLLVDARGTGASTGTWARAWDNDQRDDLIEILDWLVAQPWSDGTVGGFGTSYDGTTAMMLAATGHPAVKAVVARFSLYDAYRDITAPGGVPNDGFCEPWSAMNWARDGLQERGTCELPVPLTGEVRPVEAESISLEGREHNMDVWAEVGAADARITPLPDLGMGTPLARHDDLVRAGVPLWLWSGWYDGAYAASQLAMLADPDLDTRVTIGPYAHGAGYPPLGDPLQPELPNVPMAEQVADMAGYLRHHQQGAAHDPSPARLTYFRLGDGWQHSDAWPPAHVAMERMALDGPRHLDVDFTATSGTQTRWHTLLGGTPVHYPDRRDAAGLVRWVGPVLDRPTAITGTPVAHLELTSSAPDFAVHLFLEAVAPDGQVLYLTEGQLRARHRRLGVGVAPYETYGPWHTYVEEDAEPFPLDRPDSLDFVLWPISILLPAGWRWQIALAGADTASFRRIPADGDVALTVLPGSWVDVPVEGRPC
ncbi:MAG: CocE/NonD family hydrolase [Nocardioides sp.]